MMSADEIHRKLVDEVGIAGLLKREQEAKLNFQECEKRFEASKEELIDLLLTTTMFRMTPRNQFLKYAELCKNDWDALVSDAVTGKWTAIPEKWRKANAKKS